MQFVPQSGSNQMQFVPQSGSNQITFVPQSGPNQMHYGQNSRNLEIGSQTFRFDKFVNEIKNSAELIRIPKSLMDDSTIVQLVEKINEKFGQKDLFREFDSKNVGMAEERYRAIADFNLLINKVENCKKVKSNLIDEITMKKLAFQMEINNLIRHHELIRLINPNANYEQFNHDKNETEKRQNDCYSNYTFRLSKIDQEYNYLISLIIKRLKN